MDDLAIRLSGVSKFYKLYGSPRDRLREALHPLGKRYHKEFYALKDLDLEIRKGEVLGIVGKNGSGKSTLLKLISGVLTPSSGSITVNGKISALLELGAGFNPEFTGKENIRFYATLLGLSHHAIDEKMDEIIAFAEIGEFIDQPLKSYSSGMKSRLSFAVAAHIDPEILILDEVLSVGDLLFRRKCFAKMEEFFKSGITIIYVSHDLNSVNEFCHRAIFIDEGEKILEGKTKLVTNYYQKYLLARQDKKQEVKNEIAAVNEGKELVNVNPKRQDALKSKEFYIEGLVSKSRNEYRNYDVNIVDERLLNEQGERVNVLEFGKKYKFCVSVEFETDASDVAFGLDIKDIKGVLVTSIESAKLYSMKKYFASADKGDKFTLEYTFTCRLNTGPYFINCGVSSYTKAQVILNRIVDIFLFKVVNEEGYARGYFEGVELITMQRNQEGERLSLLRE